MIPEIINGLCMAAAPRLGLERSNNQADKIAYTIS